MNDRLIYYYTVNKCLAFNDMNDQNKCIYLFSNDNVINKSACTNYYMRLHSTRKIIIDILMNVFFIEIRGYY